VPKLESGHSLPEEAQPNRALFSALPLARRRSEEYPRPERLPLLGAEDHRMDVATWLNGLGLKRYVTAFCDNDVDAEVLPKLTADDLIGGRDLDRPSPQAARRYRRVRRRGTLLAATRAA
jgi:hypothetical protein